MPNGTGVRLVEVQVLPLGLRIVADGEIIARHAIAAGKGQTIIDPSHRNPRRVSLAQRPAPEDTARVAQRPLSFYDAVGHRLAVQANQVDS